VMVARVSKVIFDQMAALVTEIMEGFLWYRPRLLEILGLFGSSHGSVVINHR
jgi:hypothetical protein